MSVLMLNKNTHLLSLKMDGTQVLEIEKVVNERLLPFNLQGNNLTIENLNKWILKRLMGEKREGISKVKSDFPRFDQQECMFSLTDQYWFKRKHDQTWDDLNFFTNPYTEAVGKMFFSPWEVESDLIKGASPDLTTNGILRKAWRRENGVNYLYKARGLSGKQQPISEVLASLLLKMLDFLPFVEYELAINGLTLCSKCANFIDENTEFVPASHIYYQRARLMTDTRYTHFLKMCKLMDVDKTMSIKAIEDYMDKMIAADKIIGNDDRHFGNFGFIRNVETGLITDFAPLFDSGSSFCKRDLKAEEEAKKMGKEKIIIFQDQEERALKKIIEKYDLEKVIDCKQMFHLIDRYPEISLEKKEEMKGQIKASIVNIKQLKSIVMQEKATTN